MLCPNCNNELENGCETCVICGWENTDTHQSEWVLLGCIDGKAFADLAQGTLESSGIPVVIVSKSGFFGNVGLPLNPVFDSSKACLFEIRVPAAHSTDAEYILDMTLGDKWTRKVN